MAVLDSSIAFRARKSFGNLTLRFTGGRIIASQRVTTSNQPNTIAQKKQKFKMRLLGKLSKVFQEQHQVSFNDRKPYHSTYNKFVSINKDAVTVDNNLDTTIHWEQILASKGLLPKVSLITNVTHVAGTVTIEWNNAAGAEYDNDYISVTIVNSSNNDFVSTATTTTRAAETIQVTMPIPTTGDDVKIYIAAYNPVTNQSSDSILVEINA